MQSRAERGVGVQIYLPVQVVQRELDARLLLAAQLASDGHSVSIGTRPALLAHSAICGPGVYFLSNAALKQFIIAGKVATMALVVLDEEALVQFDDSWLEGRLTRKVLKQVSLYFCCGDSHKGIVSRLFPSEQSRLLVTGNPRFELLEERFHPLYLDAVNRIRRTVGGQYALINAASGWNELQDIEQGHSILAFAKDLAVRLPERRFVVRPHPSGSLHKFGDPIGPRNLFLANTGPIAPWLLGAAVIMHRSSTSAVEARILGRPTLTFVRDKRRVGSLQPNEPLLPDTLSAPVSNIDTAVDLVEAALQGRTIPQPPISQLNAHLRFGDSVSASRRIADAVAGLVVPRSKPSRISLLERTRSYRHGPKDRKWGHLDLRSGRRETVRRYYYISELAGCESPVRISFPQPRLMQIEPI